MSAGPTTLKTTGRKFPYDWDVAGSLLEDPETEATVLLIIVLAAYGPAVLDPESDWAEPLVLFQALEDDFPGKLHEDNENKLNALLFAVTGEEFFESQHAFLSVCSALYDGDLGGMADGVFELPEVPILLWGIWEVSACRDFSDEDGPVSLEHFEMPVRNLLSAAIQSEVPDVEDGGMDAYADNFVMEKMDEMLKRLRTLGVPEIMLTHFSASDPTPMNPSEIVP